MKKPLLLTLAVASLGALLGVSQVTREAEADQSVELLNVSYDPTRELYRQLNPMFAADYRAKAGVAVR
jgi:ABC-type sulfate transport system substrate-binding protein